MSARLVPRLARVTAWPNQGSVEVGKADPAPALVFPYSGDGVGYAHPRPAPINPLAMYAAGALMVESEAALAGEHLSRRQKRRRARLEQRYAEGRAALYSPLGRGSA